MRILPFVLLALLGGCHAANPIEDDDLPPGFRNIDASAPTCPTDLTTAVGTPCATIGMFCGTCTDPCQDCTELFCQAGTWTTVEASPVCDAGTSDGG